MKLPELAVGSEAKIIVVAGEGPLRRRLLDMGLTPGTKVLMLEPAPAGDPLAIHIRSFDLTLRREDAMNIEVQAMQQVAHL